MSGAQDVWLNIYAQCTSFDTHQTLLTVFAKELREGFHQHQLDTDRCLCCQTISKWFFSKESFCGSSILFQRYPGILFTKSSDILLSMSLVSLRWDMRPIRLCLVMFYQAAGWLEMLFSVNEGFPGEGCPWGESQLAIRVGLLKCFWFYQVSSSHVWTASRLAEGVFLWIQCSAQWASLPSEGITVADLGGTPQIPPLLPWSFRPVKPDLHLWRPSQPWLLSHVWDTGRYTCSSYNTLGFSKLAIGCRVKLVHLYRVV